MNVALTQAETRQFKLPKAMVISFYILQYGSISLEDDDTDKQWKLAIIQKRGELMSDVYVRYVILSGLWSQ